MPDAKKPKLVVLDGFALNPGDLSWASLEELADATIYERTANDEVADRLAGCEIALTNKTPVTREVFSQAGQLRYVGVLATGHDVVDKAAARDHGVVVTNIPAYGTSSVAQFTFALILELCHQTGMHSDAVRGGAWGRSKDWSFWRSPLVELDGKTLGIIGKGRIGGKVADIARSFGMTVHAIDSKATGEDLEGLLRRADIVSLHCPLTPATKGLINAQRLACMKPGAFLVNTSRGGLVVEADLAEALDSHRLAGAAVDVLPVEPPVQGSPLLSARNCIVTPHIAWATREARARLLSVAVENVRAFIEGAPLNVVS